MIVFWELFSKIIPLYGMIAMGFVASKVLGAQKETIATLLIYTIAPVVVFYGVFTAPLNAAYFTLPIVFFLIASILCGLFFLIGTRVYRDDPTKHIVAFLAGAANVGYFGLPVVLVLLNGHALSIAVLAITGIILFENTLGFFVAARGHHTLNESLRKIVTLPAVYAFTIGLLCNYGGVQLSENAITTITYFKGAYTLLGMMIIGMGLASVRWHSVDMRLISLAFLAKFIVWPLCIAAVILVDKAWVHVYTQEVYNVLIIMSVVPLAANAVAFATELKLHPEKTAVAVFASTLFALGYIPIVVGLFIR